MLGILREDDQELSLNPQPGMAGLPRLIRQLREAGLPVEMRVEGDQVAAVRPASTCLPIGSCRRR